MIVTVMFTIIIIIYIGGADDDVMMTSPTSADWREKAPNVSSFWMFRQSKPVQTSEYLNQTYYLSSKRSSHLRRFREIKTIFAFVAVEYYAQSKITSSLVLSDDLTCLLFFRGLWSLLKCHICPSVDAEVSVPAHPHRYLLPDLPPGVTSILMRAVTDAGVGPDGPSCNVNIAEGIYLSICLSSIIYLGRECTSNGSHSFGV